MRRKTGKFVKAMALTLMIVMLSGVALPIAHAGWRDTPANNPFADVGAGRWYNEYVSWAWINGVTTGTNATTFAPANNVTRGQFVTFLWRIAGRPNASPSHRFTDVSSGQFFTTPVAWAHANNIVEGINQTTFGTNRAITREQLGAMLFRYIRHVGGDTSSQSGALNRFTDRGTVSGWATSYMN